MAETEENCGVPLVQKAPTNPTTPSFALRCKNLVAHYKGFDTDLIPTKTCDTSTGKTKIYAEWDGQGEPELITWYYGYWINVGTITEPKWQFNYVMTPLTGEQVMFLNVPLASSSPTGGHTILLVATIGDCSNIPTTNGIVCLPCTGGYTNPTDTIVDCSNCCVSTYDYCNP